MQLQRVLTIEHPDPTNHLAHVGTAHVHYRRNSILSEKANEHAFTNPFSQVHRRPLDVYYSLTPITTSAIALFFPAAGKSGRSRPMDNRVELYTFV